MSSCVAELDGILQSMLALKAPGVTSSKIQSVTALCNANIQSETVLIQRIYTHFKKAPATHKLGVLYVVDSVTRAWVEQARKKGQAIGSSASDGTFAAGVNRVTELLPAFMNDLINTAPEEQKVRIGKLVDIWARGNTFPAELLAAFKQKLGAPTIAPRSTTPTGSPPKEFISLGENGNAASAAATQDTSKILKALADMAKTNTPSGVPPPASSGNVTNLQNTYAQNMPSSVNPASSVPPFGQAVGVPGSANGANLYGGMSSAPGYGPNMALQGGPVMPPAPGGAPGPSPELLQQQVQLLQMLQAQGVPQDQWATVLSVLMKTGAVGGGGGGGAAAAVASTPAAQPNWPQNGYGGREDASRDRNGGYGDQYDLRSPSGRYRDARSRSRSPSGYDRRRGPSPPRRRDSPTYGDYGRGGRNGKGRGDSYRQRSPDRYRRSASPRRAEQTLPQAGPRHIEYDHSMPPNHIKVLSRTLFVGGVTSSEEILRGIFASFGLVQTCIVNTDKRHAFVKMLTRNDAMSAKDGMERYKSADMQLRTRWGVGFGPRDCSDYQTGISVIPIDRLTDADRKWMLTAEYGGTGGKSIDSGMVVEEPDIEIGAGVSSKAISRRMATDKGGQQGPRSSRDGFSTQPQNQRFRQPERNDRDMGNNGSMNNNSGNNGNSNSNVGLPNPMSAFGGFQFPGMPPGFQFPPGFTFPGATPTQPPPPGAS